MERAAYSGAHVDAHATEGAWQVIIDALRAKGLPYMLHHADVLEQQLDQAPADQPTVRLSLSDDLFYRSVWWASWRLGITLPAKRG
jgi:hypothetical protein